MRKDYRSRNSPFHGESFWILITITGLNLIVHILRFDRIDLTSRAWRGYGRTG
jgi:hypothetical protein